MIELDISKFERQRLGGERWRLASGIGAWSYVPQFGKTYGAITFVINPHLQKLNTNSVIIVVPSEIIQKQWYNNIQSYGTQHHRIAIYTTSYILTNDLQNLECTLLVVDELHKFTTEGLQSIFNGSRINHKYRLGLTGTYPHENYSITSHFPIVDEITMEEALQNNWISNFVEYNVLLELKDQDKLKYIAHSIPINEAFEMFRNKSKLFNPKVIKDDYTLIDACYRGVKTIGLHGEDIYIKFDYICNFLGTSMGWHSDLKLITEEDQKLNTYWNPTKIHERAKQFAYAVQKRNEILINNQVKLNAIGAILKRSQKTTICFNESITFADSVANYVNVLFNNQFPAICYHSKLESRPLIDPSTNKPYLYVSGKNKGLPRIFGKTLIKRYVIDYMKQGYFKFLSTAKALDEGVSIPQIEQVICTGGTTNPLTYEQRTARGKTINIYNPDKTTIIINLVFNDFIDDSNGETIYSRDKKKLILRQRSHADRVTWVKSIDEINFE